MPPARFHRPPNKHDAKNNHLAPGLLLPSIPSLFFTQEHFLLSVFCVKYWWSLLTVFMCLVDLQFFLMQLVAQIKPP